MPQDDLSFPFSAVRGMDDAKHAILCACVNRNLRTVLIRGGPGSAKTVLARSVGGLTGMNVVNLPLNASEEQIFGGMDIEETVRQGRPVMNEGVLSRADGGILYVDDVNLMDQRVLASVLDCVDSGRVILEREGVSGEYSCDTMLIATMNPSDSDLSPHMLDRFDLCAYSDFPNDDTDGRRAILSSKERYIDDPESFVESYADEEERLRKTIGRARRLMSIVTISDELLGVAVDLASRVGADGFRGDIALVNASKAIAALNDRDEVMRKDLENAAMICLAHRRNYTPPPQDPPEPPADEPDEVPENSDRERDGHDDGGQQDSETDPGSPGSP